MDRVNSLGLAWRGWDCRSKSSDGDVFMCHKKRAVCSGHKSTRTPPTNKIQEQENVSYTAPYHQCVAGYLHHTGTFIQGTLFLLKHTFCSFPRRTGETSRIPPWACCIQLGSAIYNVSNVKKKEGVVPLTVLCSCWLVSIQFHDGGPQ